MWDRGPFKSLLFEMSLQSFFENPTIDEQKYLTTFFRHKVYATSKVRIKDGNINLKD